MVYGEQPMQFIKISTIWRASIRIMFLILSGDHIYKMDYEVMLDYHKQRGAECTIAVMARTDGGSEAVRHHDHGRERKDYGF